MKPWPLSVSPFTLRDRLSIAKWIVSCDRYTMGAKVAEFEERFHQMSGMLALGVASGSVANQLIFDLWKHQNPKKNGIVICPAVTWSTSITPAMHAGIEVRFCDVNLEDFSFHYERLETMLKKIRNQENNRSIILWPTALIGFVPDMDRLNQLARRYGAEIFLDSCENTVSRCFNADGESCSILASAEMTSTSCYFSHQVVAIEFGFAFFRRQRDYDLAKMWRNHGMSRSLPEKNLLRQTAETNALAVDPQFLFAVPGHNMRPSEIHAMFGLLDLPRMESSRKRRNHLYNRFALAPWDKNYHHVPKLQPSGNAYCLPIFTLASHCDRTKKGLRERGIEVRPIVGGNLLRQPFLVRDGQMVYGNPKDFPNAEWIHRRGFYVGLHKNVTEDMIDELSMLLIKRIA